jgi:selenobiotic family peptide radical SAM maturase
MEKSRVKQETFIRLEAFYPLSRSFVNAETWERLVRLHPPGKGPEHFSQTLARMAAKAGLPGFLGDLARLEYAVASAQQRRDMLQETPSSLRVNPTLSLVDLFWKDLTALLNGRKHEHTEPKPGEEMAMVWIEPQSMEVRAEVATPGSLLSLKMAAEGIDAREVARTGHVSVGSVEGTVDAAVKKGILVAPPSRLRRDHTFPRGENVREDFFVADVFTLQWHITQSCDLRCKHCYDRSDRIPLKIDAAYRILDDLYEFCRGKAVRGQVSFSGGNPFLYPYFTQLYRAASERGFGLAILGNPVERRRVEDIIEIEKPVFFQVSLEGLEDYNDEMRGPGHFVRTLDFLGLLRDLGIYSMVMLTLTKGNLGQVLPLAEVLRHRTDLFTFNRLSLFGEGANLSLPAREEYAAFLENYLYASQHNPVMALKDNLFNILHYQKGMELFGGCAGYGCSAAFNFLSLLPDGEVHACRKFPSLVGNVFESRLAEIYDSPGAMRYRKGCAACTSCAIRPVCGGCLAIASSLGLDAFQDRDPFCFLTAKGDRERP